MTYTLTCSGASVSGSAARSATLNVEAQSAYTATSIVEDFVGGAARTNDPRLVNPWGLAFGPTSSIWVANNHSDTATIYDGNGRPSPIVAGATVSDTVGAGGVSPPPPPYPSLPLQPASTPPSAAIANILCLFMTRVLL